METYDNTQTIAHASRVAYAPAETIGQCEQCPAMGWDYGCPECFGTLDTIKEG